MMNDVTHTIYVCPLECLQQPML